MRQDKLPLPWNKALLAIIPGLVATLGLITTDFSIEMLIGQILLAIFLVSVYWWNQRQLPGWSLMAAGMLTSSGLMLASGLFGGLAAMIAGRSANTMVLLILFTILIALWGFSMRRQSIPRVAWVILILIIICQLAVRIKYFALLGISWSVAGQWLNISLYSAMVGLLLPVVFGVLLSRKYGLQTMLFVIGMIYVSFQILIDVNSKVSAQIGHTEGYVIYKALIPFLITVLAPLWYLRARTFYTRIVGVLSFVGLAVLINLLVVGISYEGKLPIIIWISFIPYIMSVLLTLVFAYLLFQNIEERQTPREP